jgi:hypothetical protein
LQPFLPTTNSNRIQVWKKREREREQKNTKEILQLFCVPKDKLHTKKAAAIIIIITTTIITVFLFL